MPTTALPRRPPRPTAVKPVAPHLYLPTAGRPVRVKSVVLGADSEVEPHAHPWAQVAYSAVGVVRLTVATGTYLAPPSRAVWIPPGMEHAVTVVEDAELRTLYLHQPAGRTGPDVPPADQAAWRQPRVLEVSPLLRALVLEMDVTPDTAAGAAPLDERTAAREHLLGALVLDELRRARPLPLGIDLPTDKRLRSLCEAVLADPARHATLDAWALDSGASVRTLARLFRDELGTTFGQWRQQVLLARAVTLAAQRRPMAQIAAELGYASASAFSAMVRRAVGQPPSRFFSNG